MINHCQIFGIRYIFAKLELISSQQAKSNKISLKKSPQDKVDIAYIYSSLTQMLEKVRSRANEMTYVCFSVV